MEQSLGVVLALVALVAMSSGWPRSAAAGTERPAPYSERGCIPLPIKLGFGPVAAASAKAPRQPVEGLRI
jgi:hypothetical protein